MVNIQPAYQPEAGSYFNMMANIDGYAVINSSAAVTSTQLSPGVTFIKVGTGLYSVTFPKPYSFVSPTATFSSAVNTPLFPKISSITNQSFLIALTNASGVPTDPTVNCAVYFLVRARDSSVAR